MNNYSLMIVDVGQVSRGNVGASVPLVRPTGAPVFWKNRDWPCGPDFGVALGSLIALGGFIPAPARAGRSRPHLRPHYEGVAHRLGGTRFHCRFRRREER